MNENCPECVRLWGEYLKARKEHQDSMRAFSAAGGAEAVRYAVAGKAAYESKERCRAELTEHEAQRHG